MLRKSEQMYLDMSEVKMRMTLLNKTILPRRIRRGLKRAGSKFMSDTVIGLPSMPIKRPDYGRGAKRVPGELRASGALYVDGVKKETTVRYGETATGKYQPMGYGGTLILPMSHEACIVFNAPYAAEQELEWPDKTQVGAGMHFMSEKLYGNAVVYIAIVARSIRL